MKAFKTRAQRIKTGRPRKPGDRYPSGDRKRSETEREARAVVIEARMRQHGMTEEQAKTDLAGYTLGRMYMDKTIDADEHKAGVAYAMDLCRWYGDMGQPLPIAQAINYAKAGGKGHEAEESQSAQERAVKARNKLVAMRELLGGQQNPGHRLLARVLIDDDGSLRFMRADQLRAFRFTLRVLAKHYGF